jgi:hypothetical protein
MMGIITRTPYVAGTTAAAAAVNSNENIIVNEINGNLDNNNIKASAGIVDSKLAQITTSAKVSTTAITGVLDEASIGTISGSNKVYGTALISLPNIASGAGVIPFANLFGVQNKIGQIIFDLATTNSNLTVSGVGFKPNAVIFLSAKNTGEVSYSLAFSNGTSSNGVFQNASGQLDGSNGNAIVYTSGANTNVASISAMNSDGFVLNWTKTNVPTGNFYINYLALR